MTKQARSKAPGMSVTKMTFIFIAWALVLSVTTGLIVKEWTPKGKDKELSQVEAKPPVNPIPGDPPELWGPNGATYVVLGDSTAALGEKANLVGSANGCSHSSDAWPSKIRQLTGMSTADFSCSADMSSAGVRSIELAPIGMDTKWVILAYGSNDFALPKKEPVEVKLQDNLNEMIRVAKEKSPGVRVALLDYFQFNTRDCGSVLNTKRVNRIARAHDFANDTFRRIKDVTVVTVPPIPGICAVDSVIGIPGGGRGVAWHNLTPAHDLVVSSLMRQLKLPIGE